MKKVILAAAIVCLVVVGTAQAFDRPRGDVPYGEPGTGAPEIDPNMAVGAVVALAGGLTVLRHYRRRK